MSSIHFVWDERKNGINKKKHGLSFEEAKSVFYDDNARLIHDIDHSVREERFLLLGMSIGLNILVVVHCYHESEETIRIISARRATNNEIEQYEEYLR